MSPRIIYAYYYNDMKRLVVNADDFGLAESVNRGIIASHRHGILTSASLLANGSAFAPAVASSLESPNLAIGVHLNLSAGPPVSATLRDSTLLDERREFYLNPWRIGMKAFLRQIRPEEVHAEFRAQIIQVLDAGLTPTHLDGHLHVHILPQIAPIVIALARKFGIRHVRCPAEDLETTLPLLWQSTGYGVAVVKRSAIAAAVTWLARRFKERLRAAGFACPDAFYGIAQTGFVNIRSLGQLLALIPEGTSEFMCHPGYMSAEAESRGGELTGERETEVLALTASETRETLARRGIHLVTFRDWDEDLRPGRTAAH